jgi:hypothetical protein
MHLLATTKHQKQKLQVLKYILYSTLKRQNKMYNVQIYGTTAPLCYASGFMGAKLGVLKISDNINCGF